MSLYKQPNSEIWWINISHQGQRIRRSSGTTDKKLAQEYHDKLKAELWRVDKLNEEPEVHYLWNDAVKAWIKQARANSNRALKKEASFIKWWDQHLRDRKLADIDEEVVSELIEAKLDEGVTAETANRYLARLKSILNVARKKKWINAVPNIEMYDLRDKDPRWLTATEWNRLREELPHHLRQMARFAIATGLRQHNVTHLEWAWVDLRARVIRLPSTKVKGKRAFTVHLSDDAIEVLQEQKGEHPRYVFTYDKHPVNKVSGQAWIKAKKRAGIEDFRWHDFRSTWASWHVMNGTPLEVLQELGGWASLEMVKVYAHLAPGYIAKAAGNAKPVG